MDIECRLRDGRGVLTYYSREYDDRPGHAYDPPGIIIDLVLHRGRNITEKLLPSDIERMQQFISEYEAECAADRSRN